MLPEPTERLSFEEMTPTDLDDIARLLGDPAVMRYYPRPKSRTEALDWIEWSRAGYAEHGFGLWLVRTRDDGGFVGDCGLTWQQLDGEQFLEVGYHLLPARQGRGYATEAATACVAYALDVLGAEHVSAIINPRNAPSRRVAERLGMGVLSRPTDRTGRSVVLYRRFRG